MAKLKPIDVRLATTLVVASMVMLFAWQMFGIRQTALQEAGRQAMALARTAELQVIGSQHSAQLLAVELDTLLADGRALDDPGLLPVLRTRLAAYPELRSLALLDPSGNEVLTVATTRDPYSGETSGSKPGAAIGAPDIVTYRPLVTADRRPLGTARIATSARPVIEALSALPLGFDGRVWLAGANGQLIAAAPWSDGMVVPQLPSSLPAPRMMRLLNPDGNGKRLVAARPVQDSPLVVAVGLQVDSILQSWRENLILYGSAGLVLAALVLVYAWLIQRQTRKATVARREKDRISAAAAAHQRGILDAAADGLLTIDEAGQIRGVNRSAERIFSVGEGGLLGQPVAALIPTLADSPWRVGAWGELTGRRGDGRAFPLDLVVTELPKEASLPPLPGASGTSERLFIGTVRDLSEHRAAECALRASQERNAAILAAAADGILAVDPAGRLETVNAAAGRIFGYDPAAMIGQSLATLIPAAPDDPPNQTLNEFISAAELGAKREITASRSDGSRFALEIAVTTLQQADGPLFIAVLADITQRKETETALRAAKLDAEAANQAKTQFLAHMSHELRTPLNAIIGFSDMMKHEMMGPLTPVYLDYARNINDSGRQLIAIIDDLLDVSRLQLGKFSLSETEVDLHSAVAGALAMIRPRAEDNGVVLSEGVAESLPKLRGDARAIRQVLINLVSNAVKFTPRGGLVSIRGERSDDGCLLLTVADTGRGIPPEMIDRVLDPFNQADAFKANKGRGIGLGLPICRWLMELHGGFLTIKSSVAAGTTVVAGFPKDRVMRHAS